MKKVVWLGLWMTGAWCAHAQERQAQPWSVQQVLAQVASSNRSVQAARWTRDASQTDREAAKVTPPAVLSVNSQSIDPGHLGQGSLWARPIDTIVRIDKPFERGGKAEWREKVADLAEQAAERDVDDTVRQQQIAAVQAYWDLKLAQDQWQLSQANEKLAQASSDLARTRLAQGDLSRLEATRLAVEAQRAANEREQAWQQVNQAQVALAKLLAVESTPLWAADSWPASTSLSANDTASVEARPDVQAAIQRVAQAQAALSLAESQRTTDVTVGVQFEHNPPTGARLWGIGVSMPLGVDGRQDGPVRKAQVQLTLAQAALDQVRAVAAADLAAQRMTLTVAQNRVERIEHQLLPQAREAAKAADFARQQGALSLQDVLDARRTLHAAELDAASAHADAARALAALGLFTSSTSPMP